MKNVPFFPQLPLVWLPMPWATTPHQPLQPVDLTTASLSLCPTCKQTRVTKQVDIIRLISISDRNSSLSCLCFLFSSHLNSSVVSQPADEGNGLPAVKRRRVTAEMEGKYIINMPKGTTARTRRILAQQAKKGRPDPVVWAPRWQHARMTLLLITANPY